MPQVTWEQYEPPQQWGVIPAGGHASTFDNYYHPMMSRLANNGQHPAIITSYSTYSVSGTSSATSEYLVTGPDVDGDQTSDSGSVSASNWTWRTHGGVSQKYPDTSQANAAGMNFSVYNSGSQDLWVAWLPVSASYYTKQYNSSGSLMSTTNSRAMYFRYQYEQVPNPPRNARAYSSGGTLGAVDLYWDQPDDWGDATPTGYSIFINGNWWGNVGMQNSITIGGLNQNQGYTFTVAARNSCSDYFSTSSTQSNGASAAASALPDTVNSLSAYQDSGTAGRINLYWNGVSGGSGASYLNYYVYVQGENSPRVTTSGTSATINGLNNWQYYNFYVVAGNQFGTSNNSNVSGATSPGVPSAPYNLKMTPNTTVSGKSTFSWAAPARTSGGITRYTIYIYGDKNFFPQVGGGTTSVDVDGMTPGVQYNFDVRAWNQWGDNNGQNGDYSGSVTGVATGNPTAPTSLSAKSVATTVGNVDLSWAVPSNTGQGAIQFYNIYVDGVYNTSTAGSNTSIHLTGLVTNTSHEFKVAARNSWNTANSTIGPYSSPTTIAVPGVPSAPRNLGAVTSETVAGLVNLTWAAPTTIGGTAGKITHYTVYRTDSAGTVTTWDSKTASDPTVTSYGWQTVPKTNSSFYVVAWNDTGDAASPPVSSPASTTVSITSGGGAAAPTNLILTTGTASIGRLILTWLPPAGNIVNYIVTRNDGVVKTITATRYVDDTVLPGVIYSYYVKATNTTGADGTPSLTVSGIANSTSTQPVASLTVVDNTNTDLSGDFTVSSVGTYSGATGDTDNGKPFFTYRQTTPDLTKTAVNAGLGTIIDKTNVFLNGQYFGNVIASNQLTFAKSGTPFSRTAVTSGTVRDDTNVALNGTGRRVTAINPGTKAFSYAATYADTSQRPASGTIINTTNEVFNNGGNPVTITSATYNAFSYAITGANVAETTATGSVLDITNQNYFNGHYTVSSVLSPTSITYARVPVNVRTNLTNYIKNPRMETAGPTFTFRTNLCTNPSFEVDLTGWTVGSAVTAIRSTSFANTGTASMLVTKSTLADANSAISMTLTGLTSGTAYTISGYFRSGNGNAAPYFSVTGRSSSNPIILTTAWQRTSYTFTATATSHVFNIQAGAATVDTSNFYVDSILIENTSLLDTYFDGSNAATDDHSFAWVGTANLSSSNRIATSVSGVSNTANSGTSIFAVSHRTTTFANDTTHSMAMITRGAAADQHVDITGLLGAALAPNKTYTFRAVVKTMNSITDPNQIYISVTNNTNNTVSTLYSKITGTPGVYTFVGTFNTNGFADTSNTFLLWNRTGTVGSTIYVDSVMIVDGAALDIDTFTGATTSTSLTTYAWTGAVDNSTSTRTTDLAAYSGSLSAPTNSGGVARSDNPAAMDIYYRSGWLG